MSHTSPMSERTTAIIIESTPDIGDTTAALPTGGSLAALPAGGSLSALPFKLDASYKGTASAPIVCEVLGLEDVHGWSIVDEREHLALVHYDEENADMAKYGDIHGTLIDTQAKCVVASSFGYTPTAVADELKVENGSISVLDLEGENHIFPVAEATIKRIFEGVVVRAIWHQSKLLITTHKRIDPSRSRWGGSQSFLAMYQEAGGPTAEQMFDTSKPYSSDCYVFFVVHPKLLVGTRQSVQSPYMVHLSTNRMELTYPADQIAPGRATFPTSTEIDGLITEPFIHSPLPLTVEEANRHLRFGYFNQFNVTDPRLLTGDAVIMYRTENGVITDIVRVNSTSYEWRTNMRGNNPNVTNQYYSLLNWAYDDVGTDAAWNKFVAKCIPFPIYAEDDIKSIYATNQCILTIPEGAIVRNNYRSRDNRLYVLWMNFVVSLPPSLQEEGLKIWKNFQADRVQLVAWLCKLEGAHKDIDHTDYLERVKGIIGSSRRLARDQVDKKTNYAANGSIIRLPLLIRRTIRNLVAKENGPSLYALVRAMKQATAQPVPE